MLDNDRVGLVRQALRDGIALHQVEAHLDWLENAPFELRSAGETWCCVSTKSRFDEICGSERRCRPVGQTDAGQIAERMPAGAIANFASPLLKTP